MKLAKHWQSWWQCLLRHPVWLVSAAFAHDPAGRLFDALQPRHESRLLASGVALAAVGAPLPDGTPTCQLAIRLRDAATGTPVSGLVRVIRAHGKALSLPGLVSHGVGLPADHRGREWHALLGEGVVELPREELRLEAISGLETESAGVDLDLRERETAEADLSLVRFAEPAARGWRSGNTHLHLRNLSRSQAGEYLRTLPPADGIEILFVSHLLRAGADATYISNAFSPEEIRALSGDGVVFGWGEEMRHNFGAGGEGYGHAMLLNLRRLVEPVSIGPGITGESFDFPPLRPGLEAARAAGGSVIWCHNTFGFEDLPSWFNGLVDAQNIFDGGTTGSYANSFYRYLDLGLRVPFSTGTDWFLYDFARVYARLDEPLTEAGWLAALEQGRSFITNGPLLEFRVGEHGIGGRIDVTGGQPLAITGSARGRIDFRTVELVHNGRVVARSASRRVGGHFEAELVHSLRTDEAGWLALRIPSRSRPDAGDDPRSECGEVLFAHTSPVYLEASGSLRRDPEAANSLLEDLAAARAEIGAKGLFADEGQRAQVLRLYEETETALRRLVVIP